MINHMNDKGISANTLILRHKIRISYGIVRISMKFVTYCNYFYDFMISMKFKNYFACQCAGFCFCGNKIKTKKSISDLRILFSSHTNCEIVLIYSNFIFYFYFFSDYILSVVWFVVIFLLVLCEISQLLKCVFFFKFYSFF